MIKSFKLYSSISFSYCIQSYFFLSVLFSASNLASLESKTELKRIQPVFLISLSFSLSHKNSKRIVRIQKERKLLKRCLSKRNFTDEKKTIYINLATQDELKSLPGIGTKIAQNILSYRETYGFFYLKKELLSVNKIGEGIYQKIQNRISIEPIHSERRFYRLRYWTMKEWLEIGISPSMALRLTVWIQKNPLYDHDFNNNYDNYYDNYNDGDSIDSLKKLLEIQGMNSKLLNQIQKKLRKYKNMPLCSSKKKRKK